jgi:hypothetical protein
MQAPSGSSYTKLLPILKNVPQLKKFPSVALLVFSSVQFSTYTLPGFPIPLESGFSVHFHEH